ncbi:deoxynucleoside triphosphate triphosphohydrolase SAMHD1 homolog [Sabethes cyaneus]|uniref:deoxynucleoside triphosphate triphosphohydrolase SAMHD1 homolog n=1 Tax=Sabethes cyaneus TaxID=53552 RepID=UPI00237DABA5|nr:deoxynucleoside triphosphate triphosphohydrolase SAMHD1 homolog [Sabethes cyaneus]
MNSTSSTMNKIGVCNEDPARCWTLHDAVHGKVTYPGYVREIVDTPQFQRLRNLKQLGVSSSAFPCSTHTRFEHCLGVCYLAGKLLRTLEKNSGIQISDIHRKCVMLAALLHDVGHGPFSHMWENFVHSGSDKDWTHEQSSCDMACQLFADNNIQLSQESYEHYYAEQLICALITGNQEALRTLLTPDTIFLAEIVHNKHFKLDVDKWDYLLRDLFYLNGVVCIDTSFAQLFDHARVVRRKDGGTNIGYRAADYRLVVQLFEARAKLHIECYQHGTVLGLQRMIIDGLTLAEKCGFRLKGEKISEAHLSPSVYLYLDDGIINLIEFSDSAKLQPAQQLLDRVRQRRLYRLVHISSQPQNIEGLNKRFATDEFFQLHKKIPYASEMAPRNVPLYDEQGRLIKDRTMVDSIMNNLPNQGFFEQYLVYCKSVEPEIINRARKYLETLPS